MPAIHWSCNEAKLDVISAWMLKDEKYSGILWNFDENRRNFDDPIYLFAHRRIHWIDRWPLIFEVDNNWRYFKNLYELNLCWFIVDPSKFWQCNHFLAIQCKSFNQRTLLSCSSFQILTKCTTLLYVKKKYFFDEMKNSSK